MISRLLRLTSYLPQLYTMSPKRTASSTLSTTPGSKKLKLSAPGSFDDLTLPSELEGKINFTPEFKTGDGRPWNLKIVSWNVNGIRAVVKSQKLNYLKFEDPDVICLQVRVQLNYKSIKHNIM